jgi:hypothetical protein
MKLVLPVTMTPSSYTYKFTKNIIFYSFYYFSEKIKKKLHVVYTNCHFILLNKEIFFEVSVEEQIRKKNRLHTAELYAKQYEISMFLHMNTVKSYFIQRVSVCKIQNSLLVL